MHAFLLEAGGELTLVDTLYDTDGHRVLEAIRSAGRSPADLKRIVVTHGHRSHLGGLAALKRASGATVYAHAWEADIVAGERETQRVTLVPKRPLRAYFPLQVGLGKHPPCPVDEAVADEDAIGPLRVVFAPGHSPGHLAFVWPERGLLIRRRDLHVAVTRPRLAGVQPEPRTASRVASAPGELSGRDRRRGPRRADRARRRRTRARGGGGVNGTG